MRLSKVRLYPRFLKKESTIACQLKNFMNFLVDLDEFLGYKNFIGDFYRDFIQGS